MALITGSAFRHEGVPIPEEITSGSEFTVMLMEGPGYLTLERKRDPNGFYTFPSSFASHSSSNMVSSVFSPYIIGSYMGPHKSGSLTFTAAHDIDPDTVYVKVASTVENIQVEMDGGVDLDTFIIQVKTDNTGSGTTASNQFELPWIGTYDVDWGDGNTETGLVDTQTHTYSSAGTYDVSVTATTGRIQFYSKSDEIKLIDIKQWGTCQWTSMNSSFRGCSNISVLSASDTPNLSNVTSMTNCFVSCTSFNTNINNWDVSNVISMIGVFYYATSFNQPLDNWDVSNVTNMKEMFRNASSFNQDIGSWDVSNVREFFYMFREANSFNRNIGDWTFNTTSSVSMLSMFYNNTAFNNGGSSDINNWDTSRVNNMHNMFLGASAFNQPIGNWNTSNVTTMDSMFYNAQSFNQDIGSWNTSNVIDMDLMFYNASSFNQPLNSWDVSKVTNMANMFRSANNFNQPLNSWDTSNVTNMNSMFRAASSFNSNINGWDLSSVTNFGNMFRDANSFNQNIGGWTLNTTGNITMASMFYQNVTFNNDGSTDINNWNTSNVNNMDSMFYKAIVFNQPIGNWNTGNVTTIRNMLANFGGSTYAFDQDISNWDVNQMTDLSGFMGGGGTDLSTSNYDALLIAWDAQGTMSYSGTVNFGSSTYTLGGAAEAARTSLIAKWGAITDGGGV